MDNRIKSTEITTDEGSDKQTIYETTSLQSINYIKTHLNIIQKTGYTPLPKRDLIKSCMANLQKKYSRERINSRNYLLEPIVSKTKKKIYLGFFKEMLVWRKSIGHIKK